MRQNKTIKVTLPALLSIFCGNLVFLNSLAPSSVSALDYQNSTNIQFTFSPTISISISGNLSIDNLSPGTAKDSNIVDVSIATNNVSGYSLSATVGTNTINDKLTNTSNSDYYFTNLTSNIASLTSFNDNTWGYSYSTDNGANWVSGSVGNTLAGYNGLPLDTNTNTNERGKGGITLVDTYNAANTQTIKFKIGAMSSSTQAAGTYTNTINFYAITKVPPISISDSFAAAGKTQLNGYYKMQDMSPTICNMTQTIDEDSQTQLIDIRDNKIYWVAKLQDGNCWMTQNLDLNLDSNVALTSNDTDLNQFGQNNYDTNNGYACSNANTTTNCTANGEIISWIPERSTAVVGGMIVPGWKNDNFGPYSADPGEYYADKSMQQDTVGTHGMAGNYYNWTAAIALNDSASIEDSTYYDTNNNPQNSLCSSKWRLPTISGNDSATQNSDNEFSRLNALYNNGAHDNISGLMQAPLYMPRSGNVYNYDGPQSQQGTVNSAGSSARFWSSTNISQADASQIYMTMNYYSGAYFQARALGVSIRCLAK